MPSSSDRNNALRCELCGGGAATIRPFARNGAESVSLATCLGCHCRFLAPQPSDAWLAEEYRDYYRKRQLRPGIKSFHFEQLFSGLGIDFSDKCILEVGAAEGYGVAALKKLWPTSHITAIESNPESRPFFRDLDCDFAPLDLETFLRQDSRSFDAVLLFDLIEHLRSPATSLTELIRKHLRPGGVVIATFPNVDSVWRKLLGRFWFQYKVEHLFYFSRRSVTHLGSASGLTTQRLTPLTKRLPVGYLLSVGANFGPETTRTLVKVLSGFVPGRCNRFILPLSLSEFLWVAVKNG